MRLSIIIVSWNVREDLKQCLRSIAENPPSGDYEVIVVDNASTDGTAASIKKEFPKISFTGNTENRGFAAANNQGIKISKGQYILLLNPDTIVHTGALDTLTRFMDENQDAGACGPKLLNADGTTQASARRFPTFGGALYRHTILRNLRIFRGSYEKWLMKDFDHGRRCDVDQLMGAALMLRRTAIEQVGALDEKFFMYYEEVDLCRRLKEAGWRTVFVPETTITHLGGSSARQVPASRRAMMLASMLGYFRKHHGTGKTALFNIFFKPGVIIAEVSRLISGTIGYLCAFATGNEKMKEKSKAKMKVSWEFLAKHSRRFLFKM